MDNDELLSIYASECGLGADVLDAGYHALATAVYLLGWENWSCPD